jgi:thiol-disulfide isomerase/thioredoxin
VSDVRSGSASGRPVARRWILVAAGVVALGFGAWVARSLVDGGAGRDATTLLAVSLPDLAGTQQPLGQWKGKLLVVNFWATWCAPCREEMPMFVEAQKTFGDRGLQFVGIAVDEAPKVRQFAAQIGLNYPALIGGYGAMELSRTLGNSLMALPFTIIVGREGEVLLTHLGPLKREQLDRILDQSLSP